MMFFKKPKRHQVFGQLLYENLLPKLSKITAQSGHTKSNVHIDDVTRIHVSFFSDVIEVQYGRSD